MAKITLGGNPFTTAADLPAVGSPAPDFVLTQSDMKDVSLKDFAGKKKILNIVPSLDTAVCALSTRKFNEQGGALPGVVVLAISNDLPFAMKRFCTTEGIANVTALSELRSRDFGRDYGVRIVDGPFAGLFSRAVVVIDEHDKVVYTEQVSEIANEPDYAEALAAVR